MACYTTVHLKVSMLRLVPDVDMSKVLYGERLLVSYIRLEERNTRYMESAA